MIEGLSNSLKILANSVQDLTKSLSNEVNQVAKEAKLDKLTDDKTKNLLN